MSVREVANVSADVDAEMQQLLQDIPINLILDDEETRTIEMRDAATKLPTDERGGATQAVAAQEDNTNGKGERERRHVDGHPCQGLPMLTTNKIPVVEALRHVKQNALSFTWS